ncbi:MAG: ABC transporter ATP-binding protein [Spirochaetaceae bacterium]|nr:MAG: ABC transporter ATP-binding protein [Spirochaetaceae bacterium]
MELLRKLAPYLKRHRKRITIGLIGMAVFTGFTLAQPLLMRFLFNDVVEAGNWSLLLPVVALVALAPLLAGLLQFVNQRIIMRSGLGLVSDIRLDMYERILALSLHYHQDNSSGVLVNRMMDDVNMIQRLITGDTVTLFIDVIVFGVAIGVVFTLSPLLGALLMVTLVLYVAAYRGFAGKIRARSTSYRRMQDGISERLQETIGGVKHVRIYNRELMENTNFTTRTTQSLQHALHSQLNSVGLGTTCTFIAGFGSAAVTIAGLVMVLRGELQYGDVFAVNTFVWMALNPAIRLTNMAGQLTETFVSVRRVVEVLDETPSVGPNAGAPPIVGSVGHVEFDNVHFAYVASAPLYRGLSLDVAPGSTVALVGHTGCGKTTLTTLLMRHWDIQSGQIRIDGQDIATAELRSLRRLFGVVLQDPVVFDGTLRENIAYGWHDAPLERVAAAANAAELSTLVERLPDGYETLIGTHGIKLSVGEKQRVSIARAILKDPLILIMDEATSSLDSESEALIQKALDRVLKGRTSFVVAHRLSTIVNADAIVVMDSGKIIELGTHAELMAIPGGHYRDLYEELQGQAKGAPA